MLGGTGEGGGGDAAGQILTLELIAASIRFETAAVAHQKHSCWLQKGPAGLQDQISAVSG